MARANYVIRGAKPDRQVIERVEALLQPFSLSVLEDQLANPGDYEAFGTEADKELWVAQVREQIAAGGLPIYTSGDVVGGNGIEYEWNSDDEANWDRLDTAEQFKVYSRTHQWSVTLDYRYGDTSVEIEAPSTDIDDLDEQIRAMLQATVRPERLVHDAPPSSVLRVFIGHGGDRKWEAIREYIRAAGYEVEAFESSPRAGEMTLAVVERMISDAAVAVIVMTAADELRDGRKLARQNVVHELGFAQGRLGVANTIVLLEDGTEEFTNIAGLTQIRFAAGEAHTTRDHVLASLANKERERGA